MTKHLHAVFAGRVQGVGFRFAVREIARTMRITGWVRNLGDGNVELEAEADEAVLQDFLDEVTARFARHIRDVQTQWSNPRVTSDDFQILF